PAVAVMAPDPRQEIVAGEEMTVPVHTRAPAPPPEPTPLDITPVADEPPARPKDPVLVPALIAVTLGGVGLLVAQVPYGRFATVEWTGEKNKRKWTKENLLQIWVRVRNDGVARKFDFRGWSVTSSPGVAVPRLTDSAGKVLAAKTFDPGWEPFGRPKSMALF